MTTEYPSHIFEAVANGNVKALKNFVEKRYVSLKNYDSLNQTVAHIAVKHRKFSILKYLLSKDPYLLTARDGDNFTIFHRAAEQGCLGLVKYLMDKYGMDPHEPVEDVYRNTALHVAAQGGALKVMKYFIEERGVNASLKNGYQQSAAFIAAFNKHLGVIRYLIERQKVDLTEVDIRNDNILFPLVKRKDLDLIKYLLDDRRLNFDINWRGHSGRTLLHWAAKISQTNLLSYFVEEKGADVNIADENGWIPLHVAASSGNMNAIKYLVEHKANFRLKNTAGEIPAELCKSFHAKNYLEGLVMARGDSKKRITRSAFGSVPLAVPVFTPIPTPVPLLTASENRTQKIQLPMDRNTDLFGDISYIHVDTFLLFTSLIFKIFGRSRRRKHLLSSHHEIARSRTDRVAMTAAVHAHIDFEN